MPCSADITVCVWMCVWLTLWVDTGLKRAIYMESLFTAYFWCHRRGIHITPNLYEIFLLLLCLSSLEGNWLTYFFFPTTQQGMSALAFLWHNSQCNLSPSNQYFSPDTDNVLFFERRLHFGEKYACSEQIDSEYLNTWWKNSPVECVWLCGLCILFALDKPHLPWTCYISHH